MKLYYKLKYDVIIYGFRFYGYLILEIIKRGEGLERL